MKEPFIFISCGQYTEAEKSLGKDICKVVQSITGLGAFFAEQVQDLNGLDSNILAALRDCTGFIAVLHPRGVIQRPDGSKHIRASVWIEQEIAVATYIQRLTQKSLPVIAFCHESVGREGIRELLHLNPITFTENADVLAALPQRLEHWKKLRFSQADNPLLADQRKQVQIKISHLGKEQIEALYVVARDGSSTERYVLGELNRQGMAHGMFSVLEGLSSRTNFIFQEPNQDPKTRPGDRRWIINPDLKELIKDYFARREM
jgi:hypothetical protein